jgi:Ca2+-transporting ATPase
MRKKPRSQDDVLINQWVFFRYMVIGLYVGFATVGVFAYWYMYFDWAEYEHTLVGFTELSTWAQCPSKQGVWAEFWKNPPMAVDGVSFAENPCDYFQKGKMHASTLSLSVLVVIEMLNALNALSEDSSLISMPPWCNPYLLLAIAASIGVHMVILYVPVFAKIFSIVPLTYYDWVLVWAFSVPVIFIDEVLKFVGRNILHTNR